MKMKCVLLVITAGHLWAQQFGYNADSLNSSSSTIPNAPNFRPGKNHLAPDEEPTSTSANIPKLQPNDTGRLSNGEDSQTYNKPVDENGAQISELVTASWSDLHHNETTINTTVYSYPKVDTRLAIFLPIGLTGILGNSLVLLVIGSNKQMRQKQSNILIMSQAAVDLFSSIFILPMRLLPTSITRGWETGPWADFVCRVWDTDFLTWSPFLTSTLNLLLLAFERYFAICHPFAYQFHFTRGKIYGLIAGTWVVGFVLQASHLIPTSRHVDGICQMSVFYVNQFARKFTAVLLVTVQFFLPVFIMCILYGNIIYHLQKQTQFKPKREDQGDDPPPKSDSNISPRNLENGRVAIMDRAKKNSLKTLITVSVIFFVCWVCGQMYYFLFLMGYPLDFTDLFYQFTVVLTFSNCCLNPFIYVLQFKEFQQSCCLLFCGTCKEAAPGESEVSAMSKETQSIPSVSNLNNSC